jgi:hypothetical protein
MATLIGWVVSNDSQGSGGGGLMSPQVDALRGTDHWEADHHISDAHQRHFNRDTSVSGVGAAETRRTMARAGTIHIEGMRLKFLI